MKELVKDVLNEVDFAVKYAEICNTHKDYNNGMKFTKKQIEDVLSSLDVGFTYASKESSFYKDYVFGSYNARISITYKYGFVECFYTLWNTENEERVRGRFNSVASLQDDQFKTKVAHSFPVATSLEDMDSILQSLTQLNTDFMELLENRVMKSELKD